MRNLFFICGLVVLFSSCYNDKAEKLYPTPKNTTCDTSGVSYASTINPIMQLNCASSGCHNSTTVASGYDLSTYNGLVLAINSGTLLPAIKHTGSLPFMPQTGARMADCDIQKIETWINAGAQQN